MDDKLIYLYFHLEYIKNIQYSNKTWSVMVMLI